MAACPNDCLLFPALIEDHRLVAVAEDAAVEMPADGAGEHHALKVAAAGYEILHLIAV